MGRDLLDFIFIILWSSLSSLFNADGVNVNISFSFLQVSEAEEITVQFPYAEIQAQEVALTLQRPSPPFPAFTLAGAQRARERAGATAERPSAAQERDVKQ